MKSIILSALLLSVRSFGALLIDGSCQAASTACTLSATASGSFITVFAARASNTPPTLPGAYSNLGTGIIQAGAGGTLASARVACRIASGSGDTTVTGFTNATLIIAVSFSGDAAQNTLGCGTGGIGNFIFSSAKTSTSISFPALKLAHTSGSSWILAFGYASAAAPGAPTGLMQFQTVGAGPGLGGYDSNGGLTSWSAQSVTVASSTWLSAVIEIRAPNASVPSWVNKVHGSNILGRTITTASPYKLTFPKNPNAAHDGTVAGNAIVGVCTYSTSSATSSISGTDDVGDTFEVDSLQHDATVSQSVIWWSFPNSSGGAHTVSLKVTTGTNFQFGCSMWEVMNASKANIGDGGAENNGTNGTPAGTSFTPGSNNDLCFGFVTRTTPNSATSWGAGGIWTLTAADRDDGVAEESMPLASAGATNSSFSMTPNGTSADVWMASAECIKSGTSGGAHTGFFIRSYDHYSWPSLVAGTHTKQFSPSAQTGSLLAGMITSGGVPLTSVSDSAGNTWAKCGTTQGGLNVNPSAEIWYAKNATTSPTMTFTFTVGSSTDNNATWIMVEIAGADTSSPCGSSPTGATGTQSVAGNLTAPPSLTPDKTGSIVLVQGNQFFNTATSQTNANCVFSAITWLPDEPTDGPQNVDQNEQLGVCVSPSTVAMPFVWGFFSGGEAINAWADDSSEFKQAPSAGGTYGILLGGSLQ